jgi:hypothetical protein
MLDITLYFLVNVAENIIFDEEEINHTLWSRTPRLTAANQQIFRCGFFS